MFAQFGAVYTARSILPSFDTFRMAMNVVARVITWFPFPGFVATKAMSTFQWQYLIQPYVFSIALMVPCFIDRNRTTVGYFDHITRLIGSPQDCSRWFLMAWNTKQTNNTYKMVVRGKCNRDRNKLGSRAINHTVYRTVVKGSIARMFTSVQKIMFIFLCRVGTQQLIHHVGA